MSDAQDYHDKKNKAVYEDMRTAMRDFHGRELPADARKLAEKMFSDAEQATPNAVLETQIMDPRISKNEREQWARRRITDLQSQLAEARAAVREAYEVYAGSEGFAPETAPEAYQSRLINQMADILGKALAGEGKSDVTPR